MPWAKEIHIMTTEELSRNPAGKGAKLKVLFSLLMALLVLKALAGYTTADPDLWGYMAFGRLFWETGLFPYQDIFAYVPTLKVWVYHEWLTGVLFYPLYQALGAPGLQIMRYIIGLSTVGLIYLTARRRGANFWSALFCLWVVQGFLPLGYSPVRAQIFTYLFFALSLYVLETVRLSGRWRGLIVLVAIQVLWCNLHGGFVVGLGLLALYGLGEALARRPYWPYLAALAAGTLVTLINPYGVDYWIYMFRALTMPRPDVTEWASVFKAWQKGLHKSSIIYFVVINGYVGLLVWWARWREVTPALILALTLYLGLKHQRHQVFFMLAAGAYLPVVFQVYGQKFVTSLPFRNWRQCLGQMLPAVLALCFILVCCYKFLDKAPLSLKLPIAPKQGDKWTPYYPVGAVEYLQKNHLSGKILSEFNWGEYLLWNLHPQFQVAMDGRYETVYGNDLCHLYFDFSNGRPGWRRFLEEYPPDMILVDSRSRVCALLKTSSDWREVYRDEGAALFLPGVKGKPAPMIAEAKPEVNPPPGQTHESAHIEKQQLDHNVL
jgi:hypothetical protein